MNEFRADIARYFNLPLEQIRIISVTSIRDGYAIIVRVSNDERLYRGEDRLVFHSTKHEKILHTFLLSDPIRIGECREDLMT